MKELKKEIQLWLITVLILWCIRLVPKNGYLQFKLWLLSMPKPMEDKREKKIKYIDNKNIYCSNCNKPMYMGYTNKKDSELCTCKEMHLVYDKRKEPKELLPFENFFVYE